VAPTGESDGEVLERYETSGAGRFELRSRGYEDVDIETVIEDSTEQVVKLRERAKRG
jgi:hypothetical protein